ncbi:MAG: SDR family oxidoreductase [Cyclobacteriaceae bacterium]|nr:SDR family oxidoreductase [Cyclobacteriaceae bacterium]
MTDIKQKTALITGGSKGIGLGIAHALLEKGAKVAITGRDEKAIEDALKTLKKVNTAEVIGIKSDVRDRSSLESAVNQIINTWGKLDVVVANAGVGHFASIDEMDEKLWHETIDINLTGVFNTVRATVEELKKTRGYIITISSLAGTNFFAGGAAYNASKFGLTGFTQAMMLDLRKYGIKVSTIMPGSVATYFNNHTPGRNDEWKIQIEDLGKVVVDLLEMNPRTLPSKIEIRPSVPPGS